MNTKLFSYTFATPLGSLIAVADESALYMVRFCDDKKIIRDFAFLRAKYGDCIAGYTAMHTLVEKEVAAYFAGTLRTFTIPLHFNGTVFQQSVWHALQTIDYGRTASYKDVAVSLKKPTAFRAVALANSVNRFVLLVPCHRVIASDGSLGGYACGTEKKKWLLDHEAKQKL